MSKRPPTDLEIMEEIYRRYYATFRSFSKEEPSRSAKVYVPIHIETIGEHFGN
jgi:hypothetical protein